MIIVNRKKLTANVLAAGGLAFATAVFAFGATHDGGVANATPLPAGSVHESVMPPPPPPPPWLLPGAVQLPNNTAVQPGVIQRSPNVPHVESGPTHR